MSLWLLQAIGLGIFVILFMCFIGWFWAFIKDNELEFYVYAVIVVFVLGCILRYVIGEIFPQLFI